MEILEKPLKTLPFPGTNEKDILVEKDSVIKPDETFPGPDAVKDDDSSKTWEKESVILNGQDVKEVIDPFKSLPDFPADPK